MILELAILDVRHGETAAFERAFAEAKTIADEKALKLLVEATRAGHDDEVLDVAVLCHGGECASMRSVCLCGGYGG